MLESIRCNPSINGSLKSISECIPPLRFIGVSENPLGALKREPYDKANNNESRQSDRTPPMSAISNNRIGHIQAILREKIYWRASRRNKSQPRMMKRKLGNQTSSSGCACGFPRSVSPMMTNRK
jgi:hypothetical protein